MVFHCLWFKFCLPDSVGVTLVQRFIFQAPELLFRLGTLEVGFFEKPVHTFLKKLKNPEKLPAE